MENAIKILPESLVNKIAAGEVVERPASVVKELVENSIDAKAKNIKIIIRDSGRSLIQVIDDGVGMSQTDARLAFERHATSKISNVKDLFNIRTKGFRGEALSSIAAVSQVELRTRREQDPVGTRVVIEGGKFILQEPVNCPKGANFTVKNLFFNVPARRNFLKSDATEFRHILNEFYRIAIPHPQITFSLYNNNQLIYKLTPGTLKERIVSLFDKSYNKYLIPVEADAGFVRIYGYIGTPESARKRYAEQFFFVNNRFFKSSYLHRAIVRAYEKILQPELKPIYFIFFEIDPSRIDVNIHPRKIEVNFQDADSIYQLLVSAVKKALAQSGMVPLIDFDIDKQIDMIKPEEELTGEFAPEIELPDDYNPFDYIYNNSPKPSNTAPDTTATTNTGTGNRETIFEPVTDRSEPASLSGPPDDQIPAQQSKSNFINVKGKYIVTALKSGLAVIHQQRAYETIFFEQIIDRLSDRQFASQQTLYPVKITLNARQLSVFFDLKPHLEAIGYRFERISDISFNITAIPVFLDMSEAQSVLFEIINDPDATALNLEQMTLENIALLLAKTRARAIGNRKLTPEEMENIANKIFAYASPFSPSGKKNFHILKIEEIDKLFK